MRSRGWLCPIVIAALASCDPAPRGEPGSGGADAAGLPQIDASTGPVCGNGILESGETCDPPSSCPETCELPCSTGTRSGSVSTCNVTCSYTPITICQVNPDLCCPSGCLLASDGDCVGIRVDAHYAGDYQLFDLGPVPGVPVRVGGVSPKPGDPSKLLIGGAANTQTGGLYEIQIARDSQHHITGFVGGAVRIADAAFNDGGVVYGPDGVLYMTGWPANTLAQLKPGSLTADKLIDLAAPALGIAHAAAGATFVPAGYPGAGQLKIMSWAGGQWYDVKLVADGNGTSDVTGATLVTTLSGGPEGMVYVPMGSPQFPHASVLVSEWSAGVVSTYEVDSTGDPIVGTRQLFVIGLTGAEGAAIDPTSGDFLFSTFGGGDRVIVVRGFAPIG